MKASSIAIALLAFAGGAAATYFLRPAPVVIEPEPVAVLESVVKEKPPAAKIVPKTPAIVAEGEAVAPDSPTTPAPGRINNMNDLVNQSRPLLNSMVPMFTNMMKQGIDQQVERLTKELNLDTVQTDTLRQKLNAMGEQEMAEFSKRLNDPNTSPEDLIRRDGGVFAEEKLDEALKGTLTDEQYAGYSTKQLAQRAERLERQANGEVERLGGRLNLTEEQKDKVFQAVVTTSDNFDPALKVETGSAADIPQGLSREDAIRAVLTPEQVKIYDEDLSKRRDTENMWRNMFRGGPPR
jgi:hypothetical protein